MSPYLASRIISAPKIADSKSARSAISHFLDLAKTAAPDLLGLFEKHPKALELMTSIASHSPFLWRLAHIHPARLSALLACDPEARLKILLRTPIEAVRDATSEAVLMRILRLVKQEVALLVALCDLGGIWPLETVTEALSDLADAALESALCFLLKEAEASGKVALKYPDAPTRECGVTVLALGKHGARELNYSSDIDIVVFFDQRNSCARDPFDAGPVFVRIVKGIVRLLNERTGDGYVFRVDLRLRPDPGSTPVAISLESAYAYYESVGQNWERAALIKARAVAGDKSIGDTFIRDLTPFIWRKYFDFAAIADIHAMKRQIQAVKGHDTITVAGHDIKLGRGGIREIEFFCQTQQLVFGGRRQKLRGRRTLDMLNALVEDGWISTGARDDLANAYRFFRTIEHRLQMVHDEQTQRLPSDLNTLSKFAKFAGFSTFSAFEKVLTAEARRVEFHYAKLFEEGADLAAKEGSLVFTGTVDDPATLETLKRMGFTEPEQVTELVRGWHFGRRQGVTSARAREVLTELVPQLLAAFGKSSDPMSAILGFDRVLGGMPAAVELFSILREHRAILSLFADILGSAPRLAEIVAGRPHLLDAIIDPNFVETFPPLDLLIERISDTVGENDLFEDFLDRLRETGQHEMFLVGVRMLSGVLSPAKAGEAYSAIAEALIRITLHEVERRFVVDHGRIASGRVAVVGMGRLGSREMTATSDLDLVVLYDFDPDSTESDGARRLDPVVYYGRLTQRLISALTVPTRRGTLYAVDMRLRPSGNKGPAATQFKGFLDYHRGNDVETWEHLALVRARPVAGDPLFMGEAELAIHSILSAERIDAKVKKDALDMRMMVAKEKGDKNIWEFKLAPGGLMDIEFIAQTLVLSHARHHPSIVRQNTALILEQAASVGVLDPEMGETLRDTYTLQRDLFEWQRTMLNGDFNPDAVDSAFRRRLAQVAGLPDFKLLAAHLTERQAAVRTIFLRLMKN